MKYQGMLICFWERSVGRRRSVISAVKGELEQKPRLLPTSSLSSQPVSLSSSVSCLVFLRQSFACDPLSWRRLEWFPISCVLELPRLSPALETPLPSLSSTCLSSAVSLCSAWTPSLSSLNTPRPFYRWLAPHLECACLYFAWNIPLSSFYFYLHVIFFRFTQPTLT